MIELLLPGALHLFVLLAIVCVYAFRRQETRLGRLRYPLLALVVWGWIFSTPGIASALLSALENAYPRVVETPAGREPLIVVLSSGFSVKEGSGWAARLDGAGWERTWTGIRLWKSAGGKLLFVGGPTPDGASSEAAAMAEIAQTAGVPASAISVETRSRNTYENLAFTQGLVAPHGENAWLVSSALHMRRAMAVAHKLGLRLQAYPCDHQVVPLLHWYAWVPDSGGPEMFADALHEWVGLIVYRLRGYAD